MPARARFDLTGLYAVIGAAVIGAPVIALIVAFGDSKHPWSDGFFWTLYMLAFGALAFVLGLIFGVPRVNESGGTPGAVGFLPNSNLVQISDWLTKLLVGAGLVELKSIPERSRALGDFLGSGLGVSNPDAFALSAAVYGLGVGFCAGYLWATLMLRLLLEQSDSEAESLRDQVRNKVVSGDAKPDREAKRELVRAADRAVELVEATTTSPRGRAPVLWVDDHPENNKAIADAMSLLGIDVHTVLTTDQALSRLAEGQYSLIISDLGRTEAGEQHPMAGLELLQQLTQRQISIPVIIFASTRGMQHREELLAAGAKLVTQRQSELLPEAVRFVLGSS